MNATNIGRMISLMYAMAPDPNVFGVSDVHRSQKVLPKPCLLPGCGEQTTHNGGYCSAEHAKQHRERDRKVRSGDYTKNR